jgi:hypothetical protein
LDFTMSQPFRFRPSAEALEAREVPALGLGDLLNQQQYLEDNPDVRAAGISAVDHFVRFGQREGRDPNRFFETAAYLAANPDVAAAVRAGFLTGVDHFLRFGQFEGRNPNATFDTTAYLAANPDVAAAVRAGQTTAFEHFLRFGEFEDRAFSTSFRVRDYLDDNPDVRDAVQRGFLRSGTEHFVRFGFHEGRNKPIRESITLPPGQTTVTFSGTSANEDDRQFIAIRVPQDRQVRLDVTRVGGDFVNVELENAGTDVDLLELEPENGNTSGTATLLRDQLYLLRVRAVDDASATYRIVLTQL